MNRIASSSVRIWDFITIVLTWDCISRKRKSTRCLLLPLLRVVQPLRHLLVLGSDSCPTLGGSIPPKIADRHVDTAIDEELHGFVILVPHQFVQNAGGLMRAPGCVDIGSVREKKVGDLEAIVEDGPGERSIENLLRGRLATEPGFEVTAVVGIVHRKMI